MIFMTLLISSQAVMADNVILTVESGDTLYSIGRTYRVSVQELIQVNGIVNPRALKKGSRITVPRTYVIERGDTLYRIARENNISVVELSTYNDISEQTIIKTGQVLMLPSSGKPEIRIVKNTVETETLNTETLDTENSANQEEQIFTPVSYNPVEENGELIWPHNGKRSALNGKLKGTEISGSRGDQVVSVSAGEVVWVAPYRGYGTLVMVESADNHIYAYGGNESTYVEVGDKINSGTVIGSLGINPVKQVAKLFFFVYKDGVPVDPAAAPRG